MTIEFNKANAEAGPTVPALSLRVDESSIRDYLALSDQTPLLVLFTHPDDEQSKSLEEKLATLVESAQGRLVLLVVDAIRSPQLAKAFEVSKLPAVYGLLKGQPAPLFVGDQPAEQLGAVVQRVLEVASENGLSATVQISAEPAEPELTAAQLAAFEAIENGDFEKALATYERALVENPNDAIADAGRAQVLLLIRLRGKDLAELTKNTTPDGIFDRADALVAGGDPAAGFEALLSLFELSDKEARESIRERLVELFKVVGNDSEAVASARRKLSLLLF